MTDPVVVSGVIHASRTTVDRCVRLTIDLDEAESLRYVELFKVGIGALVAIAKISGTSEPTGDY